MLTVYGPLMPLRLLEEIRFWKMQEKEHTVVIRQLVSNLETPYVQALMEWEPVFAKAEFTAGRWIETIMRSPAGITPYMQMQAEGLMNASVEQSQRFVQQLMYMQAQSAAIQANPTAQVVIQHIIRESEYFLGVLQAFIAGHAFRLSGPPPEAENDSHEAAGSTAAADAPQASTLGQAFASAAFFPHKHGWAHPGNEANAASQLQLQIQNAREEASRPETETFTATGEGSWSAVLAPAEAKPVPVGGHTLPPLPYPYDALEPYIDAETMRLHHDKHHKSYVDGLNKAEKMLAKARQSGDFELIKHWEREAAFHGAGHYLHTIFWNIMAPKGGGKPTGPIAAQIEKDFGSFDKFKKHFSEAADKVEGGGWALLVWSPRSHRLEILQAEKHQNLSQWDVIPLLVLDVWEHAYYLKYQNDRAKYIEAWWNTVNWKHVNDRFTVARMIKWQPY